MVKSYTASEEAVINTFLTNFSANQIYHTITLHSIFIQSMQSIGHSLYLLGLSLVIPTTGSQLRNLSSCLHKHHHLYYLAESHLSTNYHYIKHMIMP